MMLICRRWSRTSTAFSDSISFVYLPGDVAEHGDSDAYRVVRRSLDRLQVPWCAIIGDHDVHEKSFANFLNLVTSGSILPST
jgi:Icc protein